MTAMRNSTPETIAQDAERLLMNATRDARRSEKVRRRCLKETLQIEQRIQIIVDHADRAGKVVRLRLSTLLETRGERAVRDTHLIASAELALETIATRCEACGLCRGQR